MAFISGTPLPMTTSSTRHLLSKCTAVRMSSSSSKQPVSRRDLLVAAAMTAVTTLLPTSGANAEREYANVGFLGGGEKIDVNNANVRSYLKIKGFYPNLAGLIVSNGPYESIDDLYNIPGITEDMKKTLDDNKEKLVALPPAAEYEIDKVNNGLYR